VAEQPTVISVRGEARRVVQPDLAIIGLRLWAVRPDKSAALDALSEFQNNLIELWRALGGEPYTPETARARLTWTEPPANTYAQRERGSKGLGRLTGQIVAQVFPTVRLRDHALIDEIDTVLMGEQTLTRRWTQWHVDHDNPVWREARSEAIADALSKARDYASALGGAVVGVDQLADTGLLGRADANYPRPARALPFGGSGDRNTSHPEPVEVRAGVEARFHANVRL
jgi:uncharacterized protein